MGDSEERGPTTGTGPLRAGEWVRFLGSHRISPLYQVSAGEPVSRGQHCPLQMIDQQLTQYDSNISWVFIDLQNKDTYRFEKIQGQERPKPRLERTETLQSEQTKPSNTVAITGVTLVDPTEDDL